MKGDDEMGTEENSRTEWGTEFDGANRVGLNRRSETQMTDFTADHNLRAGAYQVDAAKVAEAIMCKLALVRRGREAISHERADRTPGAADRDH